MARVCLMDFKVSGRVMTLMMTVKTMMLRPKFWNSPMYSATRLLTMGLMMPSFHTMPKNSNKAVEPPVLLSRRYLLLVVKLHCRTPRKGSRAVMVWSRPFT